MSTSAGFVSSPGGTYADLDLLSAAQYAPNDESLDVIVKLARRIASVRTEHETFRAFCDRVDHLYYTDDFSDGGADLWASDPSARTAGRSHVSVNTPSIYVDIPAALQAAEPIENMLARGEDKSHREAAAALERVYEAWKFDEDYDLKFHKLCTVKGLYGRTAGRVYWDKDAKKPCVEVIEQPRNLWLGYKSDSYTELEWGAYLLRYEPNALVEEFGVDIDMVIGGDGLTRPVVIESVMFDSMPSRAYLRMGAARVEVWDYWYREPVKDKNGKYLRMKTMNVVLAGNLVVRGPQEYPEYAGVIPYLPIFNTFVPGLPNGRSDLYDMEQLIREKMEQLTAGAQMIHNGVAGDAWQLVGPDAPTRVPAGLKPKRNELVGPGPGNRIEPITPFIAQFQLEQFLGRIDREMSEVSGLNDLLLGLAPAQVLSSSKAINALIANYETRIAIRRRLLYQWRRNVWELAVKVWAAKDKTVNSVVAKGGGRLEIIDPSLSPRDEMETATRASNLVASKLWSQARAMNAVGVDDPETEQDIIREESTDATLFPERVQIMAQLMSVLQSLGLQAPSGAEEQAEGQLSSGQQDLRSALGGQTAQNTTASQSPDQQGQTPPIPGAPPEAGGPPAPFAQGPGQPPGSPQGATSQLQTMLTAGKSTGRILTKQPINQQKLGRR